MLATLLEKITGRDDLERVASKGDINQLNAYLTRRHIHVVRRPTRFLDPDASPELIMKTMEEECRELAEQPFEPWILESAGKRRLPVFSSPKRMDPFVQALAKDLKKSLQSAAVLLPDVAPQLDIDFADLNPYSPQSWEIAIRS